MKSTIKFVTVASIRYGFMPENSRSFSLQEDSMQEKAINYIRFHGELATEEAIALYMEVSEFDFSHRFSEDQSVKTHGYSKELDLMQRLNPYPCLDKMFNHLSRKAN